MTTNTEQRQAHWQTVYRSKDEREVSWFEESPVVSLELIETTGVGPDAAIIDIGGGASRLVDALVAERFRTISVLDISEEALSIARTRLSARGESVDWIVADITRWQPAKTYDVWHDRAVFHFLREPADCAAYAARVRQAVRPGGHLIIGTFAPDGPERCSGLPIMRHDAASIAQTLGDPFQLMETRRHDHVTPAGSIQHFQFSRFRRSDG